MRHFHTQYCEKQKIFSRDMGLRMGSTRYVIDVRYVSEVCRVADRGDVRSSSSNWSDISKMFQPAATSSLKTSKTPTKDKSHPG